MSRILMSFSLIYKLGPRIFKMEKKYFGVVVFKIRNFFFKIKTRTIKLLTICQNSVY